MKKDVYLIGNAHIDPVWQWRWQEGFQEIKATFKSVLDRMKEFSDFKFTCAGSMYYEWIEKSDKKMFEEICQRVKEGRWCIAGGWYLQPDCNIPCGEAFAREGLIAQRYFLEKFGRKAEVGYNVDSFGHNGALPQILKKSGLKYYVFMRPDNKEKALPCNLFAWVGVDGTEIPTYRIPLSYCMEKIESICDKKTIAKDKLEDAVVKAIMDKVMNDKVMEELSYRLYELQNQESGIVKALQTQLAEVEQGIENMLNAIQSGIVLDSTKKRLAELEERQRTLSIEITREQIKRPALTKEQILFGIHKFRKCDITTQEGKKRLIDSFVNSIYLFDDYALVTCNFKEGTTKITFDDIENSGFGDFVKRQKNKPEQKCSDLFVFGDPNGTRTHVTTVKGWCLNRLTMGPRIQMYI